MGIKEKRIAIKMTQKEVAEKLGVDRTTYTKWETGAWLPPTPQLRPLANILGCTIDEILSDTEAAARESA